ncbi:MAG TPA: YciI family protein [Acidobacteriaceae bacterium]|nr:YciI family protein [Acidobacteriaceae bacterium]
MRYICLGYLAPGKFENMSESERNTVLDACFSYNDELRKNGHLIAEEPLQAAGTAVTVSWINGEVAVTDGPYAETKEQLGGIQVLEARDLNHAIQLISQSPGVQLQCGTIEIRPAADISELIRESERRRQKNTSR